MAARRLCAALALVALAACSHSDKPREVKSGPLYSPNGEPLSGGSLGQPKCEDAMRRWFAAVDADHDGTIDSGEFLADARRQFAAMDLERTGILTPAVLAQYRAPYIAERSRKGDRDDDDRARDKRRSGSGPGVGEDRADPVMIADASLRNRVTLDDFLASARSTFATLDVKRNGRLSSADVLVFCKSE